VAGTASVGARLLEDAQPLFGKKDDGKVSKGDAAILRFLAAAEILESDLWVQYNELGGVQDSEVPGITGGSAAYIAALKVLDGDMDQYIHDNTEDELTHFQFINAYLVAKGANPVNLDPFRILPSSRATGARQIGRLTNLMQLTVETSWWTRYRSRANNPDLDPSFVFPRQCQLCMWDSTQRFLDPIATLLHRTTSKRSRIRRDSILRPSSKAAPACIHPSHKESRARRFCESSSVSAQPRPHTFRLGRIKPAMPLP